MSLAYDPLEATARLARSDRALGKLIRRAGALTLQPERMHSSFHTLARAIVYQQLSGKAAATIFGRVQALYPGRKRLEPDDVLATADETLRAAGMSRAKTASIKDLAAKTVAGGVPSVAQLRKLSDEEILARLVQVRGIGPWTVEMLLIFRLGRPDVLPASDLGVRRGFMLTYGLGELPSHAELLQHGERWRPFRSVASWYLWRAVDLERNAAAEK